MSKTIRTSNNLTIDATGDIILDADNADVKLQDGGTEFGRISRVTSDLGTISLCDYQSNFTATAVGNPILSTVKQVMVPHIDRCSAL